MNKDKQIQALINKGFSHIGMINEAKLKCLLLKKRISKILNQKNLNFTNVRSTIEGEILQIQRDIHKYTHKLKVIEKRLREHGIVTKVE